MADAIATILILLALGYLWLRPWRELATSWTRQVIFECRDDLFDLARSGEIDFRSSEYRRIRSSLEMAIRFAHELTVWKYIVLRNRIPHAELEKSDLTEAMEAISTAATMAKVRAIIQRKNRAVLLMLVAKSPISVFFIVTGWFTYRVFYHLSRNPVAHVNVARPAHRAANRVAEVAQLEAEAVCAAA